MLKNYSIFKLGSSNYAGHRVGDIFQTCNINYQDGLISGYKLFDCEYRHCITFRLNDVYVERIHNELCY